MFVCDQELEAALSRQRKELEDIIRAKDRELEESKVKVQKDQAAAQLTDVLENELQCIICSEHFIEQGPIYPNLHIFGLWEETGAPRGNPHRQSPEGGIEPGPLDTMPQGSE
eukprot:g32769.t1